VGPGESEGASRVPVGVTVMRGETVREAEENADMEAVAREEEDMTGVIVPPSPPCCAW